MHETIHINLGSRSYDIAITSDEPSGLGPFAAPRTRGRLAFLVTDERIAPHAHAAARSLESAGFRTATAVLPPGEGQKALPVASSLYDRLADLRADRSTLV